MGTERRGENSVGEAIRRLKVVGTPRKTPTRIIRTLLEEAITTNEAFGDGSVSAETQLESQTLTVERQGGFDDRAPDTKEPIPVDSTSPLSTDSELSRRRTSSKRFTSEKVELIKQRLSQRRASLRPVDLRILDWRFGENPIPKKQIALELGLSPQTIRRYQTRAMRELFPEWYDLLSPRKKRAKVDELLPLFRQKGNAQFESAQNLLRSASQGDNEAFARLYQVFAGRIYAHMLVLTENEQLSQDLVQEVFSKIFTKIKELDFKNESAFLSYLFETSTNLAINHFRRLRRRPAVSLEKFFTVQDIDAEENTIFEDDFDLEELAQQSDLLRELRSAIRKLPEAQRDVIILRFIHGLNIGETANALEKRDNNVKVLQHKAIGRLRKLMAGGKGTRS